MYGHGMRIDDLLYFAPPDGEHEGITFEQVRWARSNTDWELPRQIQARVERLYLNPAQRCAAGRDAFAAGLLLLAAIDAMATLAYGVREQVGLRFRRFAEEWLPSFRAPTTANRLYEDFRNGLVHQALIKNRGQFSLEIPDALQMEGAVMVVNPSALEREVRDALARVIEHMESDEVAAERAVEALQKGLAEVTS
jgi:hypothetical protein